MADLVITPANVVKGNNAQTEAGILGATVTAGQVVYLDPTTRKYLLADNNAAALPAKSPKGIALNGGSINQPVVVHKGGDIAIGATVVVGTPYFLSDAPGGICPLADLLTGENVVLLGIAISTTTIKVGILDSGVAVP